MEPMSRPLGHSTNMVGLPTGLLGSVVFNHNPPDVHIANVRETNGRLFDMLAQSDMHLVAIEGYKVKVRLAGACVRCGLANETLGGGPVLVVPAL